MPMRRDELGERTYEPTPLRLAEARRQGLVARSRDLTAAALLLGAVAVLGLLARRLLEELTGMTATLLDGRQAPLAPPDELAALCAQSAGGVLGVLAPFALAVVLVAVMANLVQVGLLATAEPLRADLGRLSPAEGLRRLFSTRSLARLAFAVAKLAAVALVAALTIRSKLPEIAAMGRLGAAPLAAAFGHLAYVLALRGAAALFVVALIDYAYQRWQHRHDLRMTRREWLDDMKRMEGHPLTRRRRRGATAETTGAALPVAKVTNA